MESQEELHGVARRAPLSSKRSCIESLEELCGVLRGIFLEIQEELLGVANFFPA